MEVKFCTLLLMATAATAAAGETKEAQCVSYNMEPELYKAYQQALEEAASNTDTVLPTEGLLPSCSPPAEVVTITVATVVNYIVNISWPYSLDQGWYIAASCYPAFTNNTGSSHPSSPPPPWVRGLIDVYYDAYDSYCSGCDELQWSKDTDSGSHLLLVKSIKGLLPLLNAFQTSIYSILYQGTNKFDVHVHTEPSTLILNLTIPELSKMPANYELRESLTSALTWVSQYAAD